MVTAHAHLKGLSIRHFEAVAAHLAACLSELGVPEVSLSKLCVRCTLRWDMHSDLYAVALDILQSTHTSAARAYASREPIAAHAK